MAWIVGIKTKSVARKNRSNGIVAPPVANFLIVASFSLERRTK
jgi:hypothetical protein